MAAPTPPTVWGVTVFGSVRTRLESWDWFGTSPNGTYTYPASLVRIGAGRSTANRAWQIELAVPALLDLPAQPIGAGPAGLGASYFIANNRRAYAAGLFAKQAFFRLNDLGGVKGQSLKVGRMEFFDGTEASPKNDTLAALKRDRVAARLLANFGFTHVQRSLDAVQYTFDRPTINITLLAARPTRGVFQVAGWGELDINVFYVAITRPLGNVADAGEWRAFGVAYDDYRNGVVKTDNRSLADRQTDTGHVNIATFGGHYIRAIERRGGTIDLLLWAAAQAGSWGALTHRAGSFAAEAGWQPKVSLAPWLRGGVDYGSGDHDPHDSSHNTFFQLLPTPRQYARFPFFNLMNTIDTFGEMMLKPSRRLVVRADVHSLRLADGHDLWYQGGGAFQPTTFGFSGQPVGGRQGLATLYDASGDLALTAHIATTAYYGYAAGGSASAAISPTSNHAAFGYVELLVRF